MLKNEYDFQVGDKVYDIIFGNGNVIEVNNYIEVSFPNEDAVTYTLDGKFYSSDPMRSLYHGHDLEVIVKGEKRPVRTKKRYVYLYLAEDTEHVCGSPFKYRKRETAETEGQKNKGFLKVVEVQIPDIGEIGGDYE